LVIPLLNTPAERLRVAKIVRIRFQELYTENCPYCSGVIRRVNIGTVTKDIPFCKILQTANHIAAFAAADIAL
jgi:hypothetical protein